MNHIKIKLALAAAIALAFSIGYDVGRLRTNHWWYWAQRYAHEMTGQDARTGFRYQGPDNSCSDGMFIWSGRADGKCYEADNPRWK